MTRSIWRTAALAGAVVLGAAACNADSLNIPDYNRPTVDGVGSDPVAGTQLLATGMLIADRNSYAGYISNVGIFGRESYNYFPTDARNVSHFLIGQPSPSGGKQLDPTGFASGQWDPWYGNLKNGDNLLKTVEGAPFTDQQKAAVRGFALTLQASALYRIAVTRDSLGAPTEVPANPAEPSPWHSRDEVWTTISAMLDEAATELQTAGSTAFPFAFHAGYNGFNTPATFLTYNRALAARVLVNRGSLGCAACYTEALTALNASFLNAAPATLADLNAGPAHVYSATAGDALNALNIVANNNLLAHAAMYNDGQLKGNGQKDDRVVRKLDSLASARPAPGSNNGIPAIYFFTIYPTTTSATPIIRNEELILLRAEARLRTGDVANALLDLNTVRTLSGGLPALLVTDFDTQAEQYSALLYEREMSLMWEGHRWNDMRRYGRLNLLPLDLATHFVARVMPVPKTECDARPTSLDPPVGC